MSKKEKVFIIVLGVIAVILASLFVKEVVTTTSKIQNDMSISDRTNEDRPTVDKVLKDVGYEKYTTIDGKVTYKMK